MPRAFTDNERDAIRERLLAAGQDLFARRGIRATTVEQLARAAGISKGAYYLFYPSKEALFFAIVEGVETSMQARLAQQVAEAPQDAAPAACPRIPQRTPRESAVRRRHLGRGGGRPAHHAAGRAGGVPAPRRGHDRVHRRPPGRVGCPAGRLPRTPRRTAARHGVRRHAPRGHRRRGGAGRRGLPGRGALRGAVGERSRRRRRPPRESRKAVRREHSQPAVQTDGLTRRYGDVLAVDGLDLTVERGEVYGFLGLNGAGKTTTIRMLLGMIRPSAGHASPARDAACGAAGAARGTASATSSTPPLPTPASRCSRTCARRRACAASATTP